MIRPVSGGGRERPLSVPPPSGKPVNQVDSAATVQGRLPSPNIGVGQTTVKIKSSMHGHHINASAAGHDAEIPREVHKLGVKIDAKA